VRRGPICGRAPKRLPFLDRLVRGPRDTRPRWVKRSVSSGRVSNCDAALSIKALVRAGDRNGRSTQKSRLLV
jgi:hypothetical protein